MSNLLKYEAYDADTAQAETEESESSGSGGDFWKPPVGKTLIRVLPPLAGTRWNKAKNAPSPFRVVYQHFLKSSNPDKKGKSCICPRLQAKVDKLPSRPCPICARADELFASKNPADADAAKDMNPKRNILANIILRADEERGPVVYRFGKTIHELMLGIRTDNKVSFCDPVQGFDTMLTRKGKDLNTKYALNALRDNSPLHEDVAVASAWLENAKDLDRYARMPSPEELDKMMSDEDDDIEEEVQPRRGRSAPRQRTINDDVDVIDADYEIED